MTAFNIGRLDLGELWYPTWAKRTTALFKQQAHMN